ncbi:MAG: hypothetical protein AAF804_08520 [Bacteroidota bacterium]
MAKVFLLMSGNDNLALMIFVILLFMYSPAIIMTIMGFVKLKENPKKAKGLFIAAGVYVIVGLGICGAMGL